MIWHKISTAWSSECQNLFLLSSFTFTWTQQWKEKCTLQSTLSMAKWLHAFCHTPSQLLQYGQNFLGVISGITPATRTHTRTRCPRNGWKSSTELHLVYSDRLACWIFFPLSLLWLLFFSPQDPDFWITASNALIDGENKSPIFQAVWKQQHMSVSWCIL